MSVQVRRPHLFQVVRYRFGGHWIVVWPWEDDHGCVLLWRPWRFARNHISYYRKAFS